MPYNKKWNTFLIKAKKDVEAHISIISKLKPGKQNGTYFTGGSRSFRINLSMSSNGNTKFCKLAALIHWGRFLFPINSNTLSLIGAGDSLGYLCKKYSANASSSTYCPKNHSLECPDLTWRAFALSHDGCWNAKYNKASNCLAGLSSPYWSDGSSGYPRACLASSKYSSIQALSALLSRDDGKQELNKGNDLRDNCGLLRNLRANLASSNGGFRMNLLGGNFFFGDVIFLRSASSLRSLWGLFWGSSLGSTATARMRNFSDVGFVLLEFLRSIWSGNGENEDEKERSGVRHEYGFGFWRCMKGDESSMRR